MTGEPRLSSALPQIEETAGSVDKMTGHHISGALQPTQTPFPVSIGLSLRPLLGPPWSLILTIGARGKPKTGAGDGVDIMQENFMLIFCPTLNCLIFKLIIFLYRIPSEE